MVEVGDLGSCLYSPAFKLLFEPLGLLPWPIFNAVWTSSNLAVYRAIVGQRALPSIMFEIVSGNVHVPYAGVIAEAGLLRQPVCRASERLGRGREVLI